jgi:hypothetical protein
MTYEEEMEIDETSLDLEWLDQAKLMVKMTRLQANKQKLEELAKESAEFTEAEMDKKVRMNPEKFGIDKVTEASVKSAVLTSDEYTDARKAYINAKFENTVAKGAVKACENRKDALENLVKLHGQSYFAGPRVPRNLSQEREKKEEKKQRDSEGFKSASFTRKKV